MPACPAIAWIAVLVGCSPSPPTIVPANGVVLLDGQPLANAEVTFMPQLESYGAQYNSSGVTDAQGRFELRCHFGDQPGAAATDHCVLVNEASVPDELRRMDGESQAKYAEYLRSQTNRPIPDRYGSALQSPLRIRVTPDRQTYEIQLTR
jgi:hypothetical protein